MLEEAQETTQVTNTARSDKDIRQNTDYIYTHTHKGWLTNKTWVNTEKRAGSYTEGGTEKQHMTHEAKLQSKTRNHFIAEWKDDNQPQTTCQSGQHVKIKTTEKCSLWSIFIAADTILL